MQTKLLFGAGLLSLLSSTSAQSPTSISPAQASHISADFVSYFSALATQSNWLSAVSVVETAFPSSLYSGEGLSAYLSQLAKDGASGLVHCHAGRRAEHLQQRGFRGGEHYYQGPGCCGSSAYCRAEGYGRCVGCWGCRLGLALEVLDARLASAWERRARMRIVGIVAPAVFGVRKGFLLLRDGRLVLSS